MGLGLWIPTINQRDSCLFARGSPFPPFIILSQSGVLTGVVSMSNTGWQLEKKMLQANSEASYLPAHSWHSCTHIFLAINLQVFWAGAGEESRKWVYASMHATWLGVLPIPNTVMGSSFTIPSDMAWNCCGRRYESSSHTMASEKDSWVWGKWWGLKNSLLILVPFDLGF